MPDSAYAHKLSRRNNNMDAVRYLLATSVIIAHINVLCGFDIPWPMTSFTGVAGFFTMSGFLIYRSYLSNGSTWRFIRSRALRILPAYFFIVLLCAFALGAVSQLSWADYFCNPQWVKYVVSNLLFVNFLEPSLPGVFDTPRFVSPAVNGSLWTMKIEWCLYLSVPIVAWLLRRLRGVRFFGPAAMCVTVIALSLIYRYIFSLMYEATGKGIYEILSRQFFGQLSYFYIGVLIYFRFDLFMRCRYVLLGVLVVLYALSSHIPGYEIFVRPFVIGGLVMLLSMIGRWGSYISQHDNVSYDMYLFHFPIIQLAVWLGLPALGPWLSGALILLATVILSCVSWNLIGRRFMRLRHPAVPSPATTNTPPVQ